MSLPHDFPRPAARLQENLRRLFNEFTPILYRVACLLLPSGLEHEASDLVIDVFTAFSRNGIAGDSDFFAGRRLGDIRGEELSAYFPGCKRRLVTDLLLECGAYGDKTQSQRQCALLDSNLQISQGIVGEELDVIRLAVQRLPPRFRYVLVLHYYGELWPDEICDILSLSPSQYQQRLDRGRQELKRTLVEIR